MSLLTVSDLTPTERRLCVAAAEGRLFDLSTQRDQEDDPAQGFTWGRRRQIRSQLLYQLLSGRGDLDEAFGPPLAVRLQGARIVGPLNLSAMTLRCP